MKLSILIESGEHAIKLPLDLSTIQSLSGVNVPTPKPASDLRTDAALLWEQGVSIAAIARQLRLPYATAYNWCNALKGQARQVNVFVR